TSLAPLTPTERAPLHRASVVGRIFWDDAVSHLGSEGSEGSNGIDDADAARPSAGPLDHLLARDLVFARDVSAVDTSREFLFKHALLRDVAYDSVLRNRRREYHA